MQVIWQLDDTHAGQRLFKPGVAEQWMIGYMAGTMQNEQGHYLIISLADGAVQHSFDTENKLCAALNDFGMLPFELQQLLDYNS